MSATLLTGPYGTSAVWDGAGNAYIFGGESGGGVKSNRIVRYIPASNTQTLMSATLPIGLQASSAVWDGAGNAYLFGGDTPSGRTNQIIRYTPASDSVTVLGATLPTPRAYASAVWDNTGHAYILGGLGGTDDPYLREIVQYTPATNTVSVMPTLLPNPQYGASAAWDGAGNAYLFGGWEEPRNGIIRYTPSSGTAVKTPSTLPDTPKTSEGGRSSTSAVWGSGGTAYVFAGYGNGQWLDDIVHYEATPLAPQALVAIRGSGTAQATLKWLPPSDTGGLILTGYRIYRSFISGSETPYALVANVDSYVDPNCPTDKTCYYQVAALNLAGEGEPSNEAFAPGAAVPSAPDVKINDNFDGNCVIYNDKDHDGVVDSGEGLATVPCAPDLAVKANGDGTYTVYNDKDHDDQVDSGETIATTPAPPIVDPKVKDNLDGTCTVYNDKDHDDTVDGDESVVTLQCPDAAIRDNGDGTYTVYNDKNHNGQVDSGETVITIGYVDEDGDLVPDDQEAFLCANENPNILSEGHCDGDDYTPPTAEDILSDVIWIVTGTRP